jgi:hypothetical protein
VAELQLGSTIGGYRIESVAGRGGMGVVYRAMQLGLDRVVALKVIAPDLAADPGFRERFTRESRVAASIDHPNVIPVYEAGEQDGLLYLSMRYVEGTDLGRLLKQDGRLEAQRAARIVAQVADALDAAHARGLVHRDVKPGNVLIADGNRAFLTDFGLTKRAEEATGLTKTGTWVGTVDYVAPEQVQGEAVDARTDVYALGCVLWHALSGQVPFPRPSEIARVYAHVHEQPPAVDWAQLGVPPEIDEVVRRALAKDPAARFPSAGDLGRAAMAACEGRAPSVGERTVAAGAAAPGATQVSPAWPATQTGATRALPWPPPPGPAAPPPPAPPKRRSATPFVVLAAILVLAGAGVAVAAASGVFSKSGGTHTVVNQVTAPPSGPSVSVRNVRDLLRAYATAYSNEDSGSLARLFAPDLVRRASTKPKMDKSQALAEYDRQFARLSDPTYSMSNVRITTGGGEATADADYEIRDGSGPPATGTIEFHMRVHGNLLLIDALDIRSS